MSKQRSAKELANVVSGILNGTTTTSPLGQHGAFQAFMTELAALVCAHCGGEVRMPAEQVDDTWYVGVHGNDGLPPDGGIWQDYDPEGELFDRCSDKRPNVFVDLMNGEIVATDDPSFRPDPEQILVRQDLVAREILSRLPADTKISRSSFEADADFGQALVWSSPHFDLSYWEGRTIGELLDAYYPGRHPERTNVLQYPTVRANGDGIRAKNITLAEVRDALPVTNCITAPGGGVAIRGWQLPNGVTLWFRKKH